MHDFNTCDGYRRRPERFEPQHCSDHSRDRPMFLFNDVVEILDRADLDSRAMVGVATDDRRRVGTALVDRDLLRNIM